MNRINATGQQQQRQKKKKNKSAQKHIAISIRSVNECKVRIKKFTRFNQINFETLLLTLIVIESNRGLGVAWGFFFSSAWCFLAMLWKKRKRTWKERKKNSTNLDLNVCLGRRAVACFQNRDVFLYFSSLLLPTFHSPFIAYPLSTWNSF